MHRIKLILATVAALAVMMLVAASPALALHGWEWTNWERWQATDWWCSELWFHDYVGFWSLEQMICWHPEEELWVWP